MKPQDDVKPDEGQSRSTVGLGVEKAKEIFCSFCGGSQSKKRQLIVSGSVCICDTCIEDCRDMIGEDRLKKKT